MSLSMDRKIDSEHTAQSRQYGTLWKKIAGDISAAAISATLISPVITAIDRSVVENAASTQKSLRSTLQTNIFCTFRHPRLFFSAKPFFLVWTLYAATYTTANTTDTLTRTFLEKKDRVLAETITFLTTCVVNVPLGVWKDVGFVKAYGGNTAAIPSPKNIPASPGATATSEAGAAASPISKKPTPSLQTPKFPKVVVTTFLLRDAVTIYGSFILPPIVSDALPTTFLPDPAARMAATQLFVPVLSQLIVTPVHLLGLDLYSHPKNEGSAARARRIRKLLGPATLLRCVRIVPAFGVGGIANRETREWLHGGTEDGDRD
ncbi:hypothetical protein CC80DRAFT_597574 [Byssothecium circinans]|uniref:Sequence orphan n=1 Tax=Byssothecium circinans TaxID=147558 RepID=A0A6A5THR8_9PLEO|nr:hypothetical protein CC80DRAFT_597574 [Byssothecium circinans]